MAEKGGVLEELLRDGGDVFPRAEGAGRDAVGLAEASQRGEARALPGEETLREFAEPRVVHRREQLPRPGAAASGRDEIELGVEIRHARRGRYRFRADFQSRAKGYGMDGIFGMGKGAKY
jgi:hypothetical protein